MNNLKRVLSLTLSGIMLVGMMAVGAGAVNGKDFTDQDKIQNSEAVNTLVTLNVINGKDDGSYDPEGTLTRAEMSKLIVYVLNGGKEPVLSTKATPTYTDIGGHWAEKYIEYCSNLKIVAGQGDGTFNPGGTLTGSQAAKMMMVAMNYDSNVFGFTGADWELSVTSEANKAKLFEGLDNLVASDPISRDDAAQLVYNGMLANTMKLSYSQSLSDGKITQNYQPEGPTLFAEKFDGKRYEGVLTRSGKFALSGTGSSDYFTIAQTKIDNLDLDATTSPVKGTLESFKYEKQDLTPLMGESVKVLYNDRTKTVYGVYSVVDNNTTLIKTTTNNVGDITDDEIEIDDVKYSKSDSFQIVGTIDDNSTDNLKVVDNDGDGKVDVAIVTQVGVAKVTFVGSDSVTLAKKGGNATLKASNQKTKDMIVYDDIKKDDFVIFTKDLYTDKDKVEKAELVEGSVSGIGGTDNRFQISGKWYKKATTSDVYAGIAVGDTLKMVALDNKLYYAEKVTGNQSVENVVMLITAETSDKVDAGRARLLFSDGSKKVVNVVSGAKGSTLVATGSNVGKLFTYDVNNSGEYELTAAADLGTTHTWNASGNLAGSPISTVAGTDIADDAVVFMSAIKTANTADSENDGKVITGKELKALATGTSDSTIAVATNGYYTSKSNGLTRASVLCVTLGAAATNFDNISGTSTNNYGYLVSDATYTKENGTNYIVMKVWNGEETVDVKWATSGASTNYQNFKKHNIIGYDTKGAEEITNVVKIDSVAATAVKSALTNAAITGLDGKEISFNSNNTVYKITGDTKILYVDSSASSAGSIGVGESDLQLATEPADGLFIENARYITKTVGTSLEVELIVYDVNNQLANRTKTADIAVPSGAKVIVNNSEYTSGNVKIAVGDNVKVVAPAGKTVTVSSTSNLVTDFASDPLATVSTVSATGTATASVESAVFTIKDTSVTVTITCA